MMRHLVLSLVIPSSALLLAACQPSGDRAVARALDDISAIQDANLLNLMLTASDPEEAVAYFTTASDANPDRIDLQRGLATSYGRAGRTTEAIAAWRNVTARPDAGPADLVDLADALIRANMWQEAAATLASVPPSHETFARLRAEALVADSRQQWASADGFYEKAARLTTRPAGLYNNWGFSKLARGDFAGAERLFTDALRFNPGLFTAKNNLVLARGAQRKYTLPPVTMTQIERAELLHTLALTAIKQNDVTIGRSLLTDAVNTHPRFFEPAVRALQALDGGES